MLCQVKGNADYATAHCTHCNFYIHFLIFYGFTKNPHISASV